MDSSSRSSGVITPPAKEKTARSKLNESLQRSENVNPNASSPALKFSNSPSVAKSGKSAKKAASRNPSQLALASPSPRKKIRERKFVIAKKRVTNKEQTTLGAAAVACEKCRKTIGRSKCLCVAYDNLRASQEDFFRNRGEIKDEYCDKLEEIDLVPEREGLEPEMKGNGVLTESNWESKDNVKRSRDSLLEEVKVRVKTPGSSKVMNLVKEFEKLSMLKLGDSEQKDVVEAGQEKNSVLLASDDLEQRPKAPETQISYSSFCPSSFYLTSECLGLESRRSHSLDSSRGSISTITSAGGRKSRRSSTESAANRARKNWKRKQLRVTSQRPFMLRTEERGRWKEEEFTKKLQQTLEEEEKMRIPIAQGLPWTTDEPECLVKPPVKERTMPVDLVLHSDIRAVDRSEFDQQVSMKMDMIEQYRMERERQQKLAEEEEIRRLRKELVPKAQPMPYFDRPFVPRRSEKNPTVPKEPKFHLPQQKKIKCYSSFDDLTAYCQ